ncbi:ABC transport system ATP-binding protein PA [Thermoplasma volcanium GSS1]|uniref:Molybdate/tungstate import ATP-binding protein WtpC n=1 Tax=Thermoplasma volcanium (strain ATCC 51530 / DSM 4299 / JCM 9571 / NBRC 15438 / GSS1) TaxID=273116 RepID=Q97BB1_THEVO|nr:ABC transport system ATP-binding protein PA [Thermoplasma volcanium GSS1]
MKVQIGKFQLSIKELSLSGRHNFIMGENGSGKSTFLKTIAGLIDPISGRIDIDGNDITNMPPWKRHIAYIPQNLLLFPQYKVMDNIAISIKYGQGDPEIFKEVVKVMHLEDLLERNIYQLSGGQQQRVAVARAIVSMPRILLMDEPFSMQDERSRMSLISNLLDLIDRYEIDYIYVTHNSRDLELGFDTLSIMYNGTIIESVRSIDDLQTYEGNSLIDYRDIIKIDDKYYKVGISSVIPAQDGYSSRCVKEGDYYLCVVDIDGDQYFVRSSFDAHSVRFDLSKARELSIASSLL